MTKFYYKKLPLSGILFLSTIKVVKFSLDIKQSFSFVLRLSLLSKGSKTFLPVLSVHNPFVIEPLDL